MDSLTYVSHLVERAAMSFAQTFLNGFQDFDELGLCPICQDGFELGRYGVLACGHIMHLDFWVLNKAYERCRQAPHRLPECSVCNAGIFGGLYAFVCGPIVLPWA